MPVYKDKKNNTYYIRTYIRDEKGNSKQITKRSKDWVGNVGKTLALQEEVRLKNEWRFAEEIKQEEEIQRQKEEQNVPIEKVIEKYLQQQKQYNKESTYYDRVSTITQRILPYFSGKLINEITTDDIIKWHDELNELNYALSYKQKCHDVLKNIMNLEINILGRNVVNEVGNFKPEKINKEEIIQMDDRLRYINYEEFKQFTSVIDEKVWYVYFNILYFTGMRKGEVQALTWNDIDFKRNIIKVNKTLTTKTNLSPWKITSTKNLKNRTIDIDSNLANLLKDFFEYKKRQSDFSTEHFVLGGVEPLKQNTIEHHKEKYFKLAGLPEITNHEFRHSHVSLMINEYLKTGQTDTTKFFIMMSNRLGHTIKVMQETYLHLFPDIQTPIVNLINQLNCTNS